MDEHGGTAGVITLEDLFDEVVGEIQEGSLAGHRASRRDGKGGFLVAGTVRIDEVGEALGVELEHADVDSVSGLVLACSAGCRWSAKPSSSTDVRFEVTRVERHGVGEARVSHVTRPVDQ